MAKYVFSQYINLISYLFNAGVNKQEKYIYMQTTLEDILSIDNKVVRCSFMSEITILLLLQFIYLIK